MTFGSTDIILIIGAISLALVNIITALKVKNIEHSVNSAATASAARIDALTVEVMSLTKQLSDEKQTAERLAQRKQTP